MEETKNMTLFEWIEDKINKKEEVSIEDVEELVNYNTKDINTQDALSQNLVANFCNFIVELIEKYNTKKIKLQPKQYIILSFVKYYDSFSNLLIPHYILARDKTNLQDRTITVRSFEELKIKFPEIIEKSKFNQNKLYCVHLHRGHGLGAIIQNGKFLLIDSLGIDNGFGKKGSNKESFETNELRYFENYNIDYLGKMNYEQTNGTSIQQDYINCHTFFAIMSSIINKLAQKGGTLENIINKYGINLSNKSYDLTSIFYHIGQSRKYFDDRTGTYTIQKEKLERMKKKGYIKPKEDNPRRLQNTYIQQHRDKAKNETVKYIQTLPMEEQEKLVNDAFEYFAERKRFDIHIDFKNSGENGKKSKEIDKLEIIPDLNYSCTLIENDIKTNNFENLQKHVSVIDNIDDVNFNNEPALFYFMNIINDNTDVRIIKTLIDKSDNLDNKTIKDVINSNNSINQSLKNKIVEYVNFKKEFDCRLNELNLAKTQLQQIQCIHAEQRDILKEKIQKLEKILEFLSANLNKILLSEERGYIDMI